MGEPAALRLVRSAAVTQQTSQTAGMTRTAAISASQVGSQGIFMGTTILAPHTTSGPHHHGDSETAIYVVAGAPSFLFRRSGEVTRLDARPGDFVYVPPWTPHVEENPGDETATIVLARTTQEAIVENVASL